jgi:hypothetical protein
MLSDFMGEIHINLNNLPKGKTIKKWLKLELVETGELLIEITAENFGSNESDKEITYKEIPNLKIIIKEGKNLLATDNNGKSKLII